MKSTSSTKYRVLRVVQLFFYDHSTIARAWATRAARTASILLAFCPPPPLRCTHTILSGHSSTGFMTPYHFTFDGAGLWTFPASTEVFGGPLLCWLRNTSSGRVFGTQCAQRFRARGSRSQPSWPRRPALADAWRAAQAQRTVFLMRSKSHQLDALEVYVPASAPGIWSSGMSVLDVGAGSGEIASYLTSKYGLSTRAIDVKLPKDNRWAKGKYQNLGAFSVEVFDGRSLPGAAASRDVVMFNSVLHHAATNAPGLIREAKRVARKWIVLLEDVILTEGEALPAVVSQARHYLTVRHDPNGIFRTHEEWLRLLSGDGFSVVGQGSVLEVFHRQANETLDSLNGLGRARAMSRPRFTKMGAGFGPTFQRWFVAKRV